MATELALPAAAESPVSVNASHTFESESDVPQGGAAGKDAMAVVKATEIEQSSVAGKRV